MTFNDNEDDSDVEMRNATSYDLVIFPDITNGIVFAVSLVWLGAFFYFFWKAGYSDENDFVIPWWVWVFVFYKCIEFVVLMPAKIRLTARSAVLFTMCGLSRSIEVHSVHFMNSGCQMLHPMPVAFGCRTSFGAAIHLRGAGGVLSSLLFSPHPSDVPAILEKYTDLPVQGLGSLPPI